jgi:hypothetical protein
LIFFVCNQQKEMLDIFLSQSLEMGIFKSNFFFYKYVMAVTYELYDCKKKSSKNSEDIENSNLERKA